MTLPVTHATSIVSLIYRCDVTLPFWQYNIDRRVPHKPLNQPGVEMVQEMLWNTSAGVSSIYTQRDVPQETCRRSKAATGQWGNWTACRGMQMGWDGRPTVLRSRFYIIMLAMRILVERCATLTRPFEARQSTSKSNPSPERGSWGLTMFSFSLLPFAFFYSHEQRPSYHSNNNTIEHQ